MELPKVSRKPTGTTTRIACGDLSARSSNRLLRLKTDGADLNYRESYFR
jgi:hypothetical protein